ncbi:hypothetical protein [Lachnospira multipara]|jgi:hypothetical protein|uniref:hypothetical protein n=1 Tax=Lachnospira multipara TaxID=28051 RepID=UPI00048138D1|nr:hypothetical protein [Lachnospira multipara]
MLYLGSNDSVISNFNITKMFEDFFYNIFNIKDMWNSITFDEIENMMCGHEMIIVSLDESVIYSEKGRKYLDMVRKLLKRNAIRVRFLMYDYEELPKALSWIVDRYGNFVQILRSKDDPFDVFFKYTFPNVLLSEG